MIKVYIVDDERLAREELRRLLTSFENIEIVGEAANGKQALLDIPKLQPEVIFLDISMPEMTGFELLQELEEVPHIIFTTAFDEFALKAFEVNAFDYQIKPIKIERLQKSLEKLKNTPFADEIKSDSPVQIIPADRQIFIKDGEKCFFVKLNDIFLIRSFGAYAKIYFGPHAPLIHRSMNELESKLDPQVFFRVNRKEIINLRYIEKINAYFKGGMQVTLKNGEQLEISTRRSVKFKECMSL